MNNNPLVSVVIAAYNGAKYIEEQVNSILQQSYVPIEIIIVDDCSKDNTVSIIQNFQKYNPNIKLVLNEVNLGYIKNFEKGLTLASGDFIAPCDQDDIWLPDKIKICVENLQENEIVYCNSILINDMGHPTGKKLSDIKRLTNFDTCLNYAIGNSAPGHAMLFRKSVIEYCLPFPDLLPHDYWIGFKASQHGILKFIDTPLVLYRQHDSNVFGTGHLSNKKNKSREEKIELAKQRIKFLYEQCAASLLTEKRAYGLLSKSYHNNTLISRLTRLYVFLKFRNEILAFKRKNAFSKILFCIKMFFKIDY